MLAMLTFSALVAVQPIRVHGELCHPTRLIVKSEDLTRPEIKDCTVVRRFGEIGYACIEVPIGALESSFDRWKSRGYQVSLDRAAEPAFTPNDTLWPDQWNVRAMNVDQTWDIGLGQPGVTVAVVDTGVLTTHPDLAANIWVNPGEIPGNLIDDDNNGYVDDINGYDFSGNDAIPNDVNGHGTACSGIVAGVQNNALGISGIAPQAKIMALKAATDGGYFYDDANIGCYLYAVNNGARVMSMSFFSDRVSDPERVALEYCVAHGTLPVVAAGNSNFTWPYYPAAYECALSVAALNTNLNRAGFSDYGSWVDVAAPGTNVSTSTNDGNYTAGFAGTSAAAPHVAGAVALLMGLFPSATTQQIRQAIEDTGITTTMTNFGEYTNYGRVNVLAAAQALQSGSWAGKSATVRYMTPYWSSPSTRSKITSSTRIYGRGFQAPRNVVIEQSGRLLKITGRDRDWVDFTPTGALAPIEVWVDGTLIRTLTAPSEAKIKFPLIEASNFNGGLTGGFQNALFADGSVITAGVDGGSGVISLRANFRRVDRDKPLTLRIKRAYTGTATGTESISLYDWSTNSYPYGSYAVLSSGPVGSAPTTLQTFTLSNPSRFIDDEGTVYLKIAVDTPGNNLVLNLDQADLVSN